MGREDLIKLLLFATKNKLFEYAVQSAFNHIIITDIDGVIVYANSAVERITGYKVDEIIGETPRMWGKQMGKAFYEKLWHTIKVEKQPFKGEIINKRKNGELYHAMSIISPIFDTDDKLLGFIGTEEDITKEKELEKMKTEFVSITAHQLLTPLTAIRWNLEIIQETVKDKEGQDMLKTVLDQNTKLMDLVKMLLNVTRMESGRLTIDVTAFPLRDVFDAAQKVFEKKLMDKNIKLNVNGNALDTIINTDKFMLTEVIDNLVSNAIKYSPENTEINIDANDQNAEVVISIVDHGYGIPQAQQSKIFSKYFRADNIVTKEDGTGLGLYVVKMIVDELKGKITFTSEENKGTTFTLTIPKTGLESKEGQVSLSSTIQKEVAFKKEGK